MRYYYITDSKADIENFKTKFGTDDKGRDIYSLFIKYKDRLKNHGISNDITYHTKHTSKEEMLDILYRMDNQSYENEKGEISKNNYRKVYENNNWRIVEPLDWQTSMALGDGTTWCITGRYNTNGEVKPSQAEKYFNEYLRSYYQTYYFVYDKKNGKKYCVCPKPDDDIDIWNEEDRLIDSKEFLSLIGKEGIESIGLGAALPDENGFVINRNGFLKKYEGDKEEIIIPNSVKKIGNNAFESCHSLLSVTIPSSVKRIGENAFANCNSLQSVTISNGVEEIEYGAFDYCNSLRLITIPDSVKKIGPYAFYNCRSLRSITIPSSVEEMGDETFEYCESLQSIIIPGSVKKMGRGAFFGCDSLQSAIISNGVEEIGNNAFWGCYYLQKVTIPGSVKKIGFNAFHGCNSLRSIYVNDERTAKVVLENNPGLEDKIF